MRRLRRCRTQFARIGNARTWEERDPHTQRLIAIHWYNQTFEGHRVIWMDGRPHPPAYAPHTWMGFSTGRIRRQRARSSNHPPQAGLAAAQRLAGERSGHARRILRASRRSPDPHLRDHRSGVSARTRCPHHRLLPPAHRSPDLAVCLRRRRTDSRTSADEVPNYLFGKNPFVKRIRRQVQDPGGGDTLAGRRRSIRSSRHACRRRRTPRAPPRAASRRAGAAPTSRAVDPEPARRTRFTSGPAQ